MKKLSDLQPVNFNSIIPSRKSICLLQAEKLYAESIGNIELKRNPMEIAESVIKGQGKDLNLIEKRQLMFMIFDKRFDIYQTNFTNIIMESYCDTNRSLNSLFKSWIFNFDNDKPASLIVKNKLNHNIHKLTKVYQDLAVKYHLISNDPKLDFVAHKLLANSISDEHLLAMGLTMNGRALTSYSNVLLHSCAQIICQQSSLENYQSFRSIVAPENIIDKTVMLPAMIGLILGAEKSVNDKSIQEEIIELVSLNFEDPLTDADKWPSVPNNLGGTETRQQCLKQVIKWNVFRSISLFFNIIERVVDSEHKHQFPVRRKFWMTYIDNGVVEDACVILGTRAQNEIINLYSDDINLHNLKWSKLTGAKSDQCVLLMRLKNNVTVMEFSHSGKVRMWKDYDFVDSDSRECLHLHHDTYAANKLRAQCPSSQMFTHDYHEVWKSTAQKCIRKLTGLGSKL